MSMSNMAQTSVCLLIQSALRYQQILYPLSPHLQMQPTVDQYMKNKNKKQQYNNKNANLKNRVYKLFT